LFRQIVLFLIGLLFLILILKTGILFDLRGLVTRIIFQSLVYILLWWYVPLFMMSSRGERKIKRKC